MVLYLARKLYEDYEPDLFQPFLIRLEKWLNNVDSEDDKKILLSLLTKLFYAGQGEIESLYRSAAIQINRWLMNINEINIDHQNFDIQCKQAINETWICPITDSLRINSFLKINGLIGHDHRPHWRSLSIFGDPNRISAYMSEKNIKRIVLLEDFVGSGTQCASTLRYCASNFPTIDVLAIPLIVCPDGNARLTMIQNEFTNVTYEPVLSLPTTTFLKKLPQPNENHYFTSGRALIEKHSHLLGDDRFGFCDTGALIALFTNCPDNTISVFREDSANWKPLFPRIRRPE